MRYYENDEDGYVISVGVADNGGIEITEERYNAILDAMTNMPQDTDTTVYRLKTDLTYESVAIEPVEDDIDDSEALNIILGGAE